MPECFPCVECKQDAYMDTEDRPVTPPLRGARSWKPSAHKKAPSKGGRLSETFPSLDHAIQYDLNVSVTVSYVLDRVVVIRMLHSELRRLIDAR